MGTAWKHWLFQSHRPPEISYFPVSDHLRTHQGQSPQSLGTPRTAGRCNRAGGGLPTAVLYPSTKIERLQRAQNWGPRRRSFSEFGWSGQSPPHTPTFLLKPEHRGDTAATEAFSCLPASCLSTPAAPRKVGAGHVRKCARLPLAASQVLCLPHPMVGKNILP